MEYEELGSRLLDRRVQYCQFRIQQAISLIDDEIERLSQRLRIYNYKIIEYRDKAQEIDIQIKSAEISQDGVFRMRTADLNTSLSRLKAYHCHQIQEIKQKYALEIESLQSDFESILRNFNQRNKSFSSYDYKMINEKYMNQEKLIQKQIEDYKSKISMYKDALQRQQLEINSVLNSDENNDFYEEINNSVVLELRHAIEERSKERYQSLNDSKKKLSECIDQIESMNRQHKIKINDLTEQINSIENEYEKQLSQLKEKHEIAMISLKNHLSEAEKRDKILSKAANKLEIENQKQLKSTKIELQTIENLAFNKNTTIHIDNFELNDSTQELNNYYSRLKKLKSEIARRSKKLHIQEEELHEKRKENQFLKREIGAVKHEIRFTGRMVGSVYPYFSKQRKKI